MAAANTQTYKHTKQNKIKTKEKTFLATINVKKKKKVKKHN